MPRGWKRVGDFDRGAQAAGVRSSLLVWGIELIEEGRTGFWSDRKIGALGQTSSGVVTRAVGAGCQRRRESIRTNHSLI